MLHKLNNSKFKSKRFDNAEKQYVGYINLSIQLGPKIV